MLTVDDGKKFEWGNQPLAFLAHGNAMDCYFTYKIYNEITSKISSKQKILFKYCINPALKLFGELEFDGLLVNSEEVDKLDIELSDLIEEQENKLKEVTPCSDINFNSGKDICVVLYDENKGFNLFPPVFTKKMAPSSSKEALDLLLEQIEDEIEFRAKNEKS